MKHTKGAWTIEENNGIIYVMDDRGIAIANIHTREDGINNNARIKEGKANTKLIAAAPELLAALQAFIEIDSNPVIHGATPAAYRTFRDMAKAAIKKATK